MTTIVQDSVNILGSKYTIDIRSEKVDPELKNRYGYIFYAAKQIVLQDLVEAWPKNPVEYVIFKMRECLRHEIVHAFLYESGLHDSSVTFGEGWAGNEEMVDWFAIQSPKIYKAMRESKCL